MARIYLFDCEKCGYQARVAGGFVEAIGLTAQTIHCLECHALSDAVTALKVPLHVPPHSTPPHFEEVVNPLQSHDRGELCWQHFEPACAVSPDHEVREWRHPGKCPLCGSFLEPSGLPFREWD
jgi:hypothetical protein